MQKQKKGGVPAQETTFLPTSNAKMVAQGGIYPYVTHSSTLQNTINDSLVSSFGASLADSASERCVPKRSGQPSSRNLRRNIKKRRGIIGQTRLAPTEPTREWLATHAKQAMRRLTPIIRRECLDPLSSLILVATQMDAQILEESAGMTETEIRVICGLICHLWQEGILRPDADYPHTLEATLSADDDESEE